MEQHIENFVEQQKWKAKWKSKKVTTIKDEP